MLLQLKSIIACDHVVYPKHQAVADAYDSMPHMGHAVV
jgi:hypothetical protein